MVKVDRQQEQDAIDVAVADWVARRGDLAASSDPDEFEKFCAWLNADPRHGETYDEFARVFEDIGKLDQISIQGLRTSELKQVRPWPVWLGMAVAASLVAVVFIPAGTLQEPKTFTTAKSEVRQIVLVDGSAVTLGADSQMRVRFSEKRRDIELLSGEAYFDVSRDSARPLYVTARNATIRVVGTKFEVHFDDSGTRVRVKQGRVVVHGPPPFGVAAPATRVLTAGQATKVSIKASRLGFTPEVLPLDVAPERDVASWTAGRLAYDDARLADIVSDINRYYPPGVKLTSGHVGDMRVTASFSTQKIPSFLNALSATLPVSIDQAPDGAVAVSSR